MNNQHIIEKAFLKELSERIKKLRNSGYGPERIGRLLEYSSKIIAYKDILEKLELKEKEDLREQLNSLKIQGKDYKKYIDVEFNQDDLTLCKNIKRVLETYLEMIFFGNKKIGMSNTKEGEFEIIEYFLLTSGRGEVISNLFPYRKILIIKKGNNYNIFSNKKHLSKAYEQVFNLGNFEIELKTALIKIIEMKEELDESAFLETYVFFLFRSIYPLISELGSIDSLPDKIIKKIS